MDVGKSSVEGHLYSICILSAKANAETKGPLTGAKNLNLNCQQSQSPKIQENSV